MDTIIVDLFKSDPFANMLGIELIEYEVGYAKTWLKVTEDMLNFQGFTNGSVLFSLADYAFAVASNSHGRVAVGLNVHMSYLVPGKVGDELICVATEIKRTSKIASYEMKIYLPSNKLVATMEGMVYIKKEMHRSEK